MSGKNQTRRKMTYFDVPVKELLLKLEEAHMSLTKRLRTSVERSLSLSKRLDTSRVEIQRQVERNLLLEEENRKLKVDVLCRTCTEVLK